MKDAEKVENAFIKQCTDGMKRISPHTVQHDLNWRYIQEHPVRFSFAFVIAFSVVYWLIFAGLTSIVSFGLHLLEPEKISRDQFISLLVSTGAISLIVGVVFIAYIWGQYLVRWNKIRAFRKDLSHPDEHVRQHATFELGRLFDPLAVPSLLRALQDPSADVRAQAAVGLGDTPDPRAVPALLQALQERDALVRGAAVQALGYMRDEGVIAPLIRALSDPDSSIRSTAATALSHFHSSRTIDPLIHALHDNDALVRWHVVWALENIGDSRVIPALRPMLHDTNISVREIATTAIAHLQNPESTKPKTSEIIIRAFSYAEVTDTDEQQ